MQAVLCWSEYYNGKWQPAKTSDVDRPTLLGDVRSRRDDAFRPLDAAALGISRAGRGTAESSMSAIERRGSACVRLLSTTPTACRSGRMTDRSGQLRPAATSMRIERCTALRDHALHHRP